MSSFRPAVKDQMKARVALCGPTGAGKTWTALEWATVLADGGTIALIDTEQGSASLYAPHFKFDTLRWAPPYDPGRLSDVLLEAQADGYAVVVIDSLTHFWTGEGGTLDVVDSAAQRNHGNKFVAWGIGTPLQRKMVDTILGLDCHVIATMRSKMEYILEEVTKNGRTTTKPTKVGMAPEQRAGVEYEFTIVGDLDHEHRIVISKSRCDVLADQVVQPGRAAEAATTFLSWLNDGEAKASPAEVAKIGAALKALPEEQREQTNEALKLMFGPANEMRASEVAHALELIEAAK